MKYLFLFQWKAQQSIKFTNLSLTYDLFAKELYTDLEALQEQGLISVDESDEDKIRIPC